MKNYNNTRKAILCFIRRDNEVLLIHDNYPDGVVWNGISGYIEEGEGPRDAVVREVKEEIGLDVDVDDLKYLGEHDMFEIFEVYKFKGEPTPIEDGIIDIQWFPLNAIPYDKMHEDNINWFPKFLI